MILSIVFALLSAAAHAIAAVTQQRAAAEVPMERAGEIRLIWRLLRTPRWLFGKGLDFIGVIFQAVALASGSLTVVQAVMTTTVLMALVITAARDHRRMEHAEWLGALGIVLGLALLIGVGRPVESDVRAALPIWLLVLAAACAVVLAGLTMARRRVGDESAGWLSLAAGTCFAVDAALLKRALELRSSHPYQAVAWLMVFGVLILIGNICLARAFQSGSLRASLPIFTAIVPIIDIGLGSLLFHEHLRGGWSLVVALVGAAITVIAGMVCARSEAEHLPVRLHEPVA